MFFYGFVLFIEKVFFESIGSAIFWEGQIVLNLKIWIECLEFENYEDGFLCFLTLTALSPN